MRRTRATALAATAAALALAMSACSDPTAGGPDGDGANGDTSLNVYLYQSPTAIWSPMVPGQGADQLVMSMIYDGLYGVDDKYQLQPHLATGEPEVSADGTTFTFTLRDDIVWSDGTPFTSKDVVYTYNLMANPATGSARAGQFADVEGVAEVKAGTAQTATGFSAPDDTTFVIKTTKPNVGLVGLTGAILILPEHILKDVPAAEMSDAEFFSKPTVGLGPFTFVQYKTDQYVELKANEKYHDPVAIDTVYLRPVTSDVATAQLGTGEMDLVQISPADLDTVKKLENVEVASAAGPGFIRLSINQTQPRFADPRVRQAMLYAIDRQGLVDEALAGEGSILNSSFMGEALPDDIEDYAYDPDKAKQLLTDAGWDSSQPVQIAWVPGQRDRDTAANVVQSQLEAVGMTVELKQVQPAEIGDMTTQGNFDMTLFGGGNYATEPWAVFPIDGCAMAPPNGGNLSRFCNAELDSLMQQANSTADEATRYDLYQQAAAIENEQIPYIWLYNPNAVWAFNTRLQGFQPSGDFSNGFWNAAEWSVK